MKDNGRWKNTVAGSEKKKIPDWRASRNSHSDLEIRLHQWKTIIFEGDINELDLQIGDLAGNIHSLETENLNNTSKLEDTKECHGFTYKLYNFKQEISSKIMENIIEIIYRTNQQNFHINNDRKYLI